MVTATKMPYPVAEMNMDLDLNPAV